MEPTDLIAPIEDAALKIPKAQTDEQRWKVRQAFEKLKPPKPNISKAKRLAIKSLQDDNNIIIFPADKGNATAVMNRVEYSNQMGSLDIVSLFAKVLAVVWDKLAGDPFWKNALAS